MSSQPFAELITAYLDGVPGAAEVLNDALEDSGRPRVAIDGDGGERLAVVLEELLTEPLARRIAVDFARHVAGYCEPAHVEEVLRAKEREAVALPGTTDNSSEPSPPSPTPTIVEVTDEDDVENHARSQRSLHQGMLHTLGWGEEDSPRSSAAWALWGALLIPVLNVAQAAQRAHATELQWQIEHLKKQLLKNGS